MPRTTMFHTTVSHSTMPYLINLALIAFLLAMALATRPEENTDTTTPYSGQRFRNLLSLIPSPSLASPVANLNFIRKIASNLGDKAPTCSPNVCFAFDGSAAVSADIFSRQVQIAQIIIAVLGGLADVRFAAVQYGDIVKIISKSAEGHAQFQIALGDSVATRSPITFVAPALQFCSTQFSMSSGMAVNYPNRIVLLGGGGASTFVADMGPFGAVAVAQQFLAQRDSKISALLVEGEPAAKDFFKSVVGGGLLINASGDASVLTGIADVVNDICS